MHLLLIDANHNQSLLLLLVGNYSEAVVGAIECKILLEIDFYLLLVPILKNHDEIPFLNGLRGLPWKGLLHPFFVPPPKSQFLLHTTLYYYIL